MNLFKRKLRPNTRVVCDFCEKKEKKLPAFFSDAYKKQLLAVNAMYHWLYKQGILCEISFAVQDYKDTVYFSFDVRDLLPYRRKMEQSGIEDASLAVQEIFDSTHAPCRFSGAIQLSWPMVGYRTFDGVTSRSCETDLLDYFNNESAYEILHVRETKGIKEAVLKAFDDSSFEPPLFAKRSSKTASVNLGV